MSLVTHKGSGLGPGRQRPLLQSCTASGQLSRGPEVAQQLRAYLNEVWEALEDYLARVGDQAGGGGGWGIREHLVAIEQAMVAFGNRVRQVAMAPKDEDPYVAPVVISDPPSSAAGQSPEVLLRYVSLAVERFAWQVEELGPEDELRTCRTDSGRSCLVEVIGAAQAEVQGHVIAIIEILSRPPASPKVAARPNRHSRASFASWPAPRSA